MELKKTPDLLIFDLDGTLVDSLPGIQIALNQVLSGLGEAGVDLDWVRRHVGRGSLRLAAAASREHLAVELVHDRFLECYRRTMVANTRPFPSVDEAMQCLSEHYALAVASNKPLPLVDQLIDALDWRTVLQLVVGPESVGRHKPDPAMIEYILDRLGCAAEDALMVGDMPVDAETGANAGIEVIGVASGSASPETLRAAGCVEVVSDFRELRDALLPDQVSME